jgi:hypothetical protein
VQKLEGSKPHPLKDTKPRIRFLTKPRNHEDGFAPRIACADPQTNESGFPYSIEATKPLLRKAAETAATQHRG